MHEALTQIRRAATFEEVSLAIRRAEFSNLDSRTIQVAARKLASVPKPATSVRLALLGTHTFQPFDDYFRVRAAASAQVADCWIAPYGQYVQVVNPLSSELREFEPDILLLSVELNALAPRVVRDFGSLTVAEADSERHRILEHLLDWAHFAKTARASW